MKRVYVLSQLKDRAPHSVSDITGWPRFRVLRDNTYRREYLEGLNLTATHFKQVAHLASRVTLRRIFCQRAELDAEKMARAIEDDLRS